MGDIFTRLQALAKARGAIVQVRTKVSSVEQDGHFRLLRSRPIIRIHAQSNDTRILNDVQDAAILAHEMGHHRAWRDGEENPAYRAIVDTPQESWPSLPLATRQAIIEEERRAWRYAREELAAVGFDAWAAFEEYSSVALGGYARGLGLGEP